MVINGISIKLNKIFWFLFIQDILFILDILDILNYIGLATK